MVSLLHLLCVRTPVLSQLWRTATTTATTTTTTTPLTVQYAVVHRALHRTTKMEVAVKCIKKATLTAEDLAAIDIEVKAMERLSDHPNFVRMYEMFAEKDYFFIVLELISGGELFDRICEKEKYSEREAREIIKQLTLAIAYMHGRGE